MMIEDEPGSQSQSQRERETERERERRGEEREKRSRNAKTNETKEDQQSRSSEQQRATCRPSQAIHDFASQQRETAKAGSRQQHISTVSAANFKNYK